MKEKIPPYQKQKSPDNLSRRDFLKKAGFFSLSLLINSILPTNLFASEKNEQLRKDIKESIDKLEKKFSLKPDEYALVVDPSRQELYLIKSREILKSYPISTSKRGLGVVSGSMKTPFGAHKIVEKIGDGSPIGEIFKGLVDTKKISKIYTEKINVPEFVTTRIMRLKGLEEGINKGKGVDSFSRSIYIHGTPEEGLIGTPASHGCIRMKNKDIIELFNKISKGTLIEIQHKEY